MSDLREFPGLRPWFGQQLDPAPEASFEQQPPEPVDAAAGHAGSVRRTAARVPMIGGQRPGRRAQVTRSHPEVIGALHPDAIGQGQEGGHRQHQPVAGDAGRVVAPGLVPLSAQALDGLEAQFDPEEQGVPTHPDPFQRGIYAQGQTAGPPPGEDPPEQRREAEAHVQSGLAGTNPVAAIVEPLPQVLAEAVPTAPGREGRVHAALTGAYCQDDSADPGDQPSQPGLPGVR